MTFRVEKLTQPTKCSYCQETAVTLVEIGDTTGYLCEVHVIWMVDQILLSLPTT